MANKKFLLGIQVLALVLGMMVIGCKGGDDPPYTQPSDTRPYLSGFVEIDITRPVVGDILTATISNGNGTGTVAWEWIRGESTISGANGSTYTVVAADAGQTLKAKVSYSGNQGSKTSEATKTVIGIPTTASVSVSLETVKNTTLLTTSGKNAYYVNVYLTLSDGAWDFSTVNFSQYDTIITWVTMSGTPTVTRGLVSNGLWSFTPQALSSDRQKVRFQYYTESATNTDITISGLTATLDAAKLTAIKTYTNVTGTLTGGTSTANSSAWVIGTGY